MNVQEIKKTPRPRYCGILVHPTSFPSPYGIGDLGDGAYAFIDFLYDAGQTLWQCLPLGPTGFGDSPYQAFSAFAGQPLLISPDLLLKDGLLDKDDLADVPDFNDYSVEYGNVITYKTALLRKACAHFTASEDKALHKAFNHFCRTEKDWLEDYALFMSLKDLHQGRSWHEWSPQYQVLDTRTRKAALTELADSITYYQFIQFIFFKQWHELKLYANKKGISVIGDIPIFVSPDSADVWANQSLFKLDSKGFPTAVAGVPPDYFAKDGQLWGNPLYDWDTMARDKFSWWKERINFMTSMFDGIRIDHFRAIESYYSVPRGEKTAKNGKWIKGPGMDFVKAIKQAADGKLIIAEDLGDITPEVHKLVSDSGFPGMRVLQFGFFGDTSSPHIPHNYINNSICYTGTHDNNTLLGYIWDLDENTRKNVLEYFGYSDQNWDGCYDTILRGMLASHGGLVIFPVQDLLLYGNDTRINIPGKSEGNWTFRITREQLNTVDMQKFRKWNEMYGRV